MKLWGDHGPKHVSKVTVLAATMTNSNPRAVSTLLTTVARKLGRSPYQTHMLRVWQMFHAGQLT